MIDNSVFVASTTTRIYKYHCIVNYWQLLNCTVHMTHEITKQKSTSTFFFLLFFLYIVYLYTNDTIYNAYVLLIYSLYQVFHWTCDRNSSFYSSWTDQIKHSLTLLNIYGVYICIVLWHFPEKENSRRIRRYIFTFMVLFVIFCNILQNRKLAERFVDTS